MARIFVKMINQVNNVYHLGGKIETGDATDTLRVLQLRSKGGQTWE